MSYWELNAVVQGIVDDWYFDTEKEMNEFIDSIKEEYTEPPMKSEIRLYKQYHPHEKDFDECRCMSYELDHNPFWKIENGKEEVR